MADRTIESSPQLYARLGGVLYLAVIVLGLFGEAFVRGRLVVSGDPVATAARIRASEPLWRAGIAGQLVLLLCAVGLIWILYSLLRPVSRELALLTVLFNVVSMSIEAVITLHLVAVLFPLGGAAYLKAFQPEQLDILAYFSLRAHGYGYGFSLAFFACHCLVLGTLIYRSGFLPRAIGIGLQIAGLCYLTNTLAMILSPKLADALFPTILLPGFLGELALCFWLMVKGVNVARWRERVSGETAAVTFPAPHR